MKKKIIRFTTDYYKVLTNHLAESGSDESFIYGLFSRAMTNDCMTYICKQLVVPDREELKNQSSVSIEPDQVYQALVYSLAFDQGLSILDTHTHPFSTKARFSGIDNHHGMANASYISANFPKTTEMGMIVFGRGFDNFEARIWDRKNERFEPVNRIEVLGSPTMILRYDVNDAKGGKDDPYARHRIIPGWKQGLLEDTKVFVGGLGGNGALVFESLLALGVGSHSGWIKACDPDILEASNLPRIPYARPKDIGETKAKIAQAYAKHRGHKTNVECYTEPLDDAKMLECIKEANVIIGCIDNDGARQTLNSLASRYMVPYIDLGTEIIPEDDKYESIGQIQVFLPGRTGCLMCSGSIDPSSAALDKMDDEAKAQYAQAGYVRGTNSTPTPSVLHLNGVTCHLAISQLVRMLFADGINGKEYLHYNAREASMFTASVDRNDNCPVCGRRGYLGCGDVREISLKSIIPPRPCVSRGIDSPKVGKAVELADNAENEDTRAQVEATEVIEAQVGPQETQ
ncbi:Molybdopterin-synthase adenylyltransferase [Limihaloglobus sulfuriphilus]|uniref:Molybdopterin-synthase adenylyltransferase n=1 Tax=Limihaloglobus sulfuriphilus TaxID=1851148 RepID=A0A1Q2MFC4_9BACT|nr:ThiF family adenylyltransferase [Limihaloglobus sulfuriphilus]AQQ71396.1 Molybdopterin-synthase adenylyltransferase [Limihaloglobus sulfuriphilus]